jgi:predicted ATP-grasp superfamily ATP-dependent carboligase
MLTLIFCSLQSAIPPSTIADLYSAIASLIKESNSSTAKLIAASEERQKSYFTAELTKIREEMKAGDKREEIKAGENRE